MENGVHNKTFKEDWTEIFPHVIGFLLRIAGYPLLLFPIKKLFKGGKNLSKPFFFWSPFIIGKNIPSRD